MAPASNFLVTIVSTCTAGFVNCIDGYTANVHPGTCCFDTCNGDCCTYTDGSGVVSDACIGFTGNVYNKDGNCNGFGACQNAAALGFKYVTELGPMADQSEALTSHAREHASCLDATVDKEEMS